MRNLTKVLFIILLFAATPVAAQFDYGIKAGVNISERPTNIKGLKEGHTGWYAGPMVKFIIPVVGLGIEGNALYSNSGVTINEETFTRHSIDIPVYLRYELSIPAVKRIIKPYIATGPQFGFTVGEREFGKKIEEISSAEDLKEAARFFKFSDSNISLNIGIGVILFKHLQIQANYNIALGNTSEYSDLKNIDVSEKIESIKSKTNIWQLSLAYLF